MFRSFFASIAILATFAVAAAQTPRVDLIKELLDLPAPAPTGVQGSSPDLLPLTYGPMPLDGPPSDDAPIVELIQFWGRVGRSAARLRYRPTPSARTVERLLDFSSDEQPSLLFGILNILPVEKEIVERVLEVREKVRQRSDLSTDAIDEWLTFNTDFAIEKLVEASQKVIDKDEYVTNQEELLALAKVDWTRAAPIVERLIDDEKQPVSSALAKWASYAHALQENDEAGASNFRRQLQKIVEDKKQPDGARDLALDALSSEAHFDGRDDWYVSLFEDETLADLRVQGRSMTGLRTLILLSPPDKYAKLMIRLTESRNLLIKRLAVTNLGIMAEKLNPDALRALLPWLSDPNWSDAPAGIRYSLIRSLSLKGANIPESVPGLIQVLSNENNFRTEVAIALGSYKDGRAIPALRKAALETLDAYPRLSVISALDACGGLQDTEKLHALESFAAFVKSDNTELLNGIRYSTAPPGPEALTLSIGKYAAESTTPPDGFARAVIERLKTLRRSKPAIAAEIEEFMGRWRGPVVDAERLRRIGSGEADVEMITNVIWRADELRTTNAADISSLSAAGGFGRSIAACLAEGDAEALSQLRQPDKVAKAAVLACARIARINLPVDEIAELMNDKDATLALAADRYLESEDSVEGRTLYLAKHPGEARILGARLEFVPFDVERPKSGKTTEIFSQSGDFSPYSTTQIARFEHSLREELLGNPDLTAVFALVSNSSAGHMVVRVYKDRILYTSYDDPARYRERQLMSGEFEKLQRMILDENIDRAIPEFRRCGDCSGYEFTMFSKAGGRRYYSPLTSDPTNLMRKIFDAFGGLDNAEMKVHYRLADRIAGLEVMLADDNLHAIDVWKYGADVRVLIEDEKRGYELRKALEDEFETERIARGDDYERDYDRERKRREEIEYANVEWLGFADGKLAGPSPAPAGSYRIPDRSLNFGELQTDSEMPVPTVKSGDSLILLAPYYLDTAGIYRVGRGSSPALVRAGRYRNHAVSADGAWVVAVTQPMQDKTKSSLVRVNLKNGAESRVVFPSSGRIDVLTSAPGGSGIIVSRVGLGASANGVADGQPKKAAKPDDEPNGAEYYLVDAATGAVQQVLKGDFRPLLQQTTRNLQPTGLANEFWAAIYDEKTNETAVGRYDAVKFEFRPLVKLPEIKLTSMDIWVDEKESKIYFTYEGHLLRVPLAAVTR